MKERVENLIKKAQEPGSVISSWEAGFLESVQRQLTTNRRSLSSKQVDIVHRVEAKVKKFVSGDPSWEAQWTDEKARDFKIACNYYDNAPVRYYSHILDWAIANADKIPPANFYQKVVENKYAQKIINALKSEPKYPAGSVVMLRTGSRRGLSYMDYAKATGQALFVIEPTNRAVNAANGCRIYSLLSSVSADMFEVEERYIKKFKPSKTKKVNEDDDIPF